MYFCAACDLYVRETSASDHDQSTAHILASTRTPSLRKVWLPESNRGYQLLKGMGWKEDVGLGPKGEGRVEPVATVLKNDRAGLGVAHAPARVTHFASADFAEKARRAAARRARKRKDSPTGGDDEADDGDDDVAMDPHNLTKAQRKQLKTSEQKRDKDIAMELYTPDGLEGYEAYLR